MTNVKNYFVCVKWPSKLLFLVVVFGLSERKLKFSMSLPASTLKTTFTQRQLTGKNCNKTEFDATCELRNDCNNYEVTFYRNKYGNDQSLNRKFIPSRKCLCFGPFSLQKICYPLRKCPGSLVSVLARVNPYCNHPVHE